MQDATQGISRRQLLACVPVLALLGSVVTHGQETYPRRAVTLIVPNAPGSSFETHGAVATASIPQEFRSYLERDIAQSRKAVQVAGIQAE